MARLRENFVRGTVDNNPLTTNGVVLTSTELTDLPDVTSPDIAVIVLDPKGVNGDPEIVHVTDYSSGASPTESATILRAQEGTVAREHAQNTVWVHAPTAEDYDTSPQFQLIETIDLGTAQSTIEFSDIPQDFSDLLFMGRVRSSESDWRDEFRMRMGNSTVDSGVSDYHFFRSWNGGDAGGDAFNHNADYIDHGVIVADTGDSGLYSYMEMKVVDYTSTADRHIIASKTGGVFDSTHYREYQIYASHVSGSAVDIVQFYLDVGPNFTAGSRISLYGLGGGALA